MNVEIVVKNKMKKEVAKLMPLGGGELVNKILDVVFANKTIDWLLKDECVREDAERFVHSQEIVSMPMYCRAYMIMGIGVKEIEDFCDYLNEETNVRISINKNDPLKTKFPVRILDVYFGKCFTHTFDSTTGAFNEM